MKRTALVATLTILSATPALAHAGHGIASGFLHPFLGWDHVLAMLAVGAWGATMGGRSLWALPAAFLGMMIAGGALGMSGVNVPFAETMILASGFVLAALVLARVKMPVWSGMAIVGSFALAHGVAHGAEMPELANPWIYGAGFVAATALIHALGAIAALGALKLRTAKA